VQEVAVARRTVTVPWQPSNISSLLSLKLVCGTCGTLGFPLAGSLIETVDFESINSINVQGYHASCPALLSSAASARRNRPTSLSAASAAAENPASRFLTRPNRHVQRSFLSTISPPLLPEVSNFDRSADCNSSEFATSIVLSIIAFGVAVPDLDVPGFVACLMCANLRVTDMS